MNVNPALIGSLLNWVCTFTGWAPPRVIKGIDPFLIVCLTNFFSISRDRVIKSNTVTASRWPRSIVFCVRQNDMKKNPLVPSSSLCFNTSKCTQNWQTVIVFMTCFSLTCFSVDTGPRATLGQTLNGASVENPAAVPGSSLYTRV